MKKIIDYFPFFIEKELLELRVNLLKDHVDKFIISETNKTHNGDSKEFICKKVIDDLNLPKDKIQVIETIIPEDHEITPEECDYVYSSEAKSTKPKNWSRERIQRDALMNHIDEYDDDTVFIMSDCDEIINPNFLSNFSNICRSLDDNIIKVPLVLLEGRADKRIYDNDIPVDWDRSMVLCTKKHLKNGGTPTKFRGEYLNPFPPLWIYQNEKLVKDCGWHFTWMGDKNSKKYKAKTSVLSDNLLALNNLSSNSMDEIVNDKNNTCILKDYPLDFLPKIIFQLPRVKEFLLPEIEKEIDWNLENRLLNFYNHFDSKFGEWGWCSIEKSSKIISSVLSVCKDQDDPICVEIGVYGGKSLSPFALALKKLKKGKVYGIDPWSNKDALVGYDHPSHQQFWGNVDLQRMKRICFEMVEYLGVSEHTILIESTSDESPKIENISVLHLDGQHTQQLISDINKYAVNVIPGGYCFIDDIDWSEDTLKAIPLMESLGFKKVNDIRGCFIYMKTNLNENVISVNCNTSLTSTCWIVDNFYETPNEIRNFALQQDYHEGGIGRGFIGRRTYKQFLFPGLKEKFEEIMGRKITAWEEHTENGKFQIAWAGEPLVYHWDSQKWGAVLYLTPDAPFECGTTLFAHKKTRGRNFYEVSYNDAFSGVLNETTTHLDRTPFEPVDVMGNVFNRLVIFDGSCIHSASEYFGCNKNSGRLWQMFFFDTE